MKNDMIFIVEDHKTYCKVIKEGSMPRLFKTRKAAEEYITTLPKLRGAGYRVAII